MEIYLPSIFLLLVAYIFTIKVIPQLSSYVIMIGAIGFLFLTIYNHYSLFADEYRVMTWIDTAKQFGPTLIVILIIALMGGYLLFMYSPGKGSSLKLPPSSIPPPESATNPMTRGIGNSLAAMGTPIDSAEMRAQNSVLNRGV
jgi:hypothetical protein